MKTRKVIAGLLVAAIGLAGFCFAPNNVEAAVASDVIYEVFAETDLGNAPAFDGITEGLLTKEEAYALANEEEVSFKTVDAKAEYLFGGWYYLGESEDGDYELCPAADENYQYIIGGMEFVDNYGLYFAKWVPASILSVKAQNTAGTDANTSETNTRIISSVDSLDYLAVGFEVLLNNKTKLDGIETTKVYDQLIGSGAPYTAEQIFGNGASHFVVWRLTGIEKINYEKIIYVRPYWITADGVRVDGLAKYVHIEDEYNGYISVPINLNVLSTAKVAAGVVEISYPAGLELVEDEVETGRVFEEREFADKGTTVKIAANVQDINNNKTANDIYMNLRFKVTDISKLDANGDNMVHTECDFEIQGTPDFCNNAEEKVTIDIWDVLY